MRVLRLFGRGRDIYHAAKICTIFTTPNNKGKLCALVKEKSYEKTLTLYYCIRCAVYLLFRAYDNRRTTYGHALRS